MRREDDSDPLPIDIILEILSRSSEKSIARFRLASKFCASLVSGPDFTELYLTRSSTRPPRLLFAINYYAKWSLYSSPQPQNPDENHSLVVAADFYMQFTGDVAPKNICGLVSDLLYFPNMRISKKYMDKVPMICNPSTGQYMRLPPLRGKNNPRSLLGYDPIGKQYKVLAISNEEVNILTLGTAKLAWKKIKCPVNHHLISEAISINGVLYYIAEQNNGVKNIACFDVRYEELRFFNAPYNWHIKLIDYKGKLGVISWLWLYVSTKHRRDLTLYLWTLELEDDQKQEWLDFHYNLPVNIAVQGDVSVLGMTADGEIILAMDYLSNPFFVFYFNPGRNTFKGVEIKGFEALRNRRRVYTFVDYAEDLKFV